MIQYVGQFVIFGRVLNFFQFELFDLHQHDFRKFARQVTQEGEIFCNMLVLNFNIYSAFLVNHTKLFPILKRPHQNYLAEEVINNIFTFFFNFINLEQNTIILILHCPDFVL